MGRRVCKRNINMNYVSVYLIYVQAKWLTVFIKYAKTGKETFGLTGRKKAQICFFYTKKKHMCHIIICFFFVLKKHICAFFLPVQPNVSFLQSKWVFNHQVSMRVTLLKLISWCFMIVVIRQTIKKWHSKHTLNRRNDLQTYVQAKSMVSNFCTLHVIFLHWKCKSCQPIPIL